MDRRSVETVQETSLGYAGGKPNPLNPPYQGDFPLNSPLIRGARGVKNDERWVSCTVSVEKVKHVGIDEKSFRKGQSYASLLYDLNASRVLEVVTDRTTESATALLSTLPEQRRNEVTAVAVDMWVPFMTAVGATLPNAPIIHDKFHIVSYLTTMVDAVRRTHRAEVSC